MSSIEVKEIVYHCQCRRFVKGAPSEECSCHECGRVHTSSGFFSADNAAGS